MNAGYQAVIGIWFLVLFLWLGWLDVFLLEKGVNKKILSFILMVWLFGIGWSVSLSDTVQFSIFGYGLPLLLGLYLWGKEGDHHRLHLLASSLLAGSSLFFLKLLVRIDPILMVLDEKYLAAFLAAFLVLVATRQAVQQFVVFSLGIAFGEICFQFYVWQHTGVYYLGTANFWDTWWVTFYVISFSKILIAKIKLPSILKRKGAETT